MTGGILGKIFGGGGGGSGGARGPGGAGAVVGLAGKHPAWPDHIRGHGYLGRPDATLESVASAFYRALEKVIDSGAWGSPGNGARPGILPYGHDMLWLVRRGGASAVVAGRMWPGRDQTGREQYPMIAWALLPGWSERAGAGGALPVLAVLEERVRAASQREGVEAAIQGAEGALAAGPPVDSAQAMDNASLVATFAADGDEGGRLLARLTRDSRFLAGQGAAGGRGESEGAAIVVRTAMRPASRENLAALASLGASAMPAGVDVLVVSGHGREYADLIAHTSLRANELVQVRRDDSLIVPVQGEAGFAP